MLAVFSSGEFDKFDVCIDYGGMQKRVWRSRNGGRKLYLLLEQ